MALPASGPISGSQIATELDVEAANISLSGMIDSSSLSPTNPDQYSEFYGYASRISALRYASTVGKPAFACNLSFSYTVPFYFSASGLGLRGKTAYTSPSGSGVLANGNYPIGIITGSPISVITVTGGTGYIDDVYECGEGP
jgi:hypothetical protein